MSRQGWDVGSRVFVRSNPHEPGAENIAGVVQAYRPRAGFGGCDLVDVVYTSPVTGCRMELPFGPGHLTSLTLDVAREAALNLEKQATELRRLAGMP